MKLIGETPGGKCGSGTRTAGKAMPYFSLIGCGACAGTSYHKGVEIKAKLQGNEKKGIA